MMKKPKVLRILRNISGSIFFLALTATYFLLEFRAPREWSVGGLCVCGVAVICTSIFICLHEDILAELESAKRKRFLERRMADLTKAFEERSRSRQVWLLNLK